MDKGIRAYAETSAMMRPELLEMKHQIRNLKKDAEMRLTLDMEAQQSFEFLSDQVHGLRRAFSTLSDVLIEEVDHIRSEAAGRNAEMQQKLAAQAKTSKSAKAELALLRSEAQADRAALSARVAALEERLDGQQEDLRVLAQEVAKASSAQHVVQLELVELRAQLKEEERARQSMQSAIEARLSQLSERIDANTHEMRSSVQALDSDVGRVRSSTERQLTALASFVDGNKAKLLQCAQAIEKQWTNGKALHQRIDSMGSASALQYKQLQERVEGLGKQHARWRASVEEATKSLAAEAALLHSQCRQLEAAVGGSRSDARRLIAEHEAETQRQCDTLGRAIHSLADTLNLTSPLIALGSLSPTR